MSCARLFPDLDVQVHLYAHDVRFLQKLGESLSRLDSRFVMLHAHDDFMIPEGVERCVEFLSAHSEYCVARGRIAMLSLTRGDSSGTSVNASLIPHPMRGYEMDDPRERLLEHLRRYSATFYSVHERRELIESFRMTEQKTQNVIFFRYLSSCMAAYSGKVRCIDELFYVRQGHADSWRPLASRRLRALAYAHHVTAFLAVLRGVPCRTLRTDGRRRRDGCRDRPSGNAALFAGLLRDRGRQPGRSEISAAPPEPGIA
jgi:glycosyltransferase domain-containing protein